MKPQIRPIVPLVLSMSLLPLVASAQIAFTDASSAAGITRRGESYGASFGDMNGDGYLDIFASNHRLRASLWINQKNGTFNDIGGTVTIFKNRPGADQHGASWADLDNDGDQDLTVSTGTGNYTQLLVNENNTLVDRAVERGLDVANLGGRLPIWLDYDGDRVPDVVMTQYGGIAKLYRQQTAGGQFVETTSLAKLLCKRFHYAQLLDVTGDDRLDFLCAAETTFPQKIYDTLPLPWKKVYDAAAPTSVFRNVKGVADSVIADFNNDGRMDMFLLSNVVLRPSGVELQPGSSTHVEAQLQNGNKGLKFQSTGKVTFDMDWNKADEGTTTDLNKILIGANGRNPSALPFTLDPADPSVAGAPPLPTLQSQLPQMHIWYDTQYKRWWLKLWSKLPSGGQAVFSEAYILIDTTAPISNLASVSLWAGDKAARPTLLMANSGGGYSDTTSGAGLAAAVQCGSATAGDFDNDMDVDLYLACRTGVSNIENILYENQGNGTFQKVSGAGGAAGPKGIAVADGVGTADTAISGDYNRDGFLDLFVTNGMNLRPRGFGGPDKLFRNVTANGNKWVQVDLVATRSDRDAVGARVRATAGGVTQYRVQNGQYHRWSQDAKRLHFGLGSASTVTLTVDWPSGSSQTFSGLAANRVYLLKEGQTTAIGL